MMKMNKREILWRVGIPLAVAVLAGSMAFGGAILAGKAELRRATGEVLPTDAPMTGIGLAAFRQYGAFVCAGEVETGLPTYTEGDGPAPEWWDPDEPMAAEWIADVADINVGDKSAGDTDVPVKVDCADFQRKDAGCPDWNVDSTMYGWDGHAMEAWEMDVFSRVFYLEFWQPDMVLCEAGCDAILQLWDLNGGTMFDTLSAITENGAYAFSTWPDVWETEYDADGLAWCKEFCMERFLDGPEWIAQYFRKGHYHDWGEWSPDPAYEICGIYFSVARG